MDITSSHTNSGAMGSKTPEMLNMWKRCSSEAAASLYRSHLLKLAQPELSVICDILGSKQLHLLTSSSKYSRWALAGLMAEQLKPTLLLGPASAYVALLFCSPQSMRWKRLLRSCQLLWQEKEKQRQKVTISVAKRCGHPLRKTQGSEKEVTTEERWEEAAPRATEGCFPQPALEAHSLKPSVCTYLHRAGP